MTTTLKIVGLGGSLARVSRSRAALRLGGYLIGSQAAGELPLPPAAELQSGKFSGTYSHRTIEGGVGHNLPQEAPAAFADAVLAVGGGAE